ncbi:MAG: class II fructose-bisphosphate aldolase, partial [Thermoplasmatota archaeon]
VYIREREPRGLTVSVGGEIGEVGKHNSNAQELEAYMDLYVGALRQSGKGPGPSKISVNTGSAHGGKVGVDGKPMKMEIDLDVLRTLSRVAQDRFGLAGAVQHGASTLPDAAFDRIPPTGACEIHLATGFQNLLFDHPRFPQATRDAIARFCHEKLADEKKPTDTDEQFVYKSRKKAFGPMKRELWTLPHDARDAIMHDMEAKFGFLFEKLGVANSKDLVAEYALTDAHPPRPVAHIEAKGTAMAAHEGE